MRDFECRIASKSYGEMNIEEKEEIGVKAECLQKEKVLILFEKVLEDT